MMYVRVGLGGCFMAGKSKQTDKGTTKITHAKQQDTIEHDKDGTPLDVKKETKHTTIIKPSAKKEKGVSVAPASQRKQMKELCT
jgi:hypothetical protein